MKSFLIIGMGKFGHHMCQNLAILGNELMVVDDIEEKVEDVVDIVEENDDWTVEFYDDEIGVVLRIYQDSLDPLNNTVSPSLSNSSIKL